MSIPPRGPASTSSLNPIQSPAPPPLLQLPPNAPPSLCHCSGRLPAAGRVFRPVLFPTLVSLLLVQLLSALLCELSVGVHTDSIEALSFSVFGPLFSLCLREKSFFPF